MYIYTHTHTHTHEYEKPWKDSKLKEKRSRSFLAERKRDVQRTAVSTKER